MHRASVSQNVSVEHYLLVGGSDYQEINAAIRDVFLTFDNINRRRSFNLNIINDSFVDLDVENFTLELKFDSFEIPPPSNVILSPNISTVHIIEEGNDNLHDNLSSVAVIGFLNTTLSALEGEITINFPIGVMQGYLDTLVTVLFTTEEATAKGTPTEIMMIVYIILILLCKSCAQTFSWFRLY